MMDVAQRTRAVKAAAEDIGFEACGIATAGPIDPEDRLGQWINKGYHADMDWMVRTKAVRQDPREKLPDAKSVVVVARCYAPNRPPQPPGTGKVARYAWGKDYHKVLKKSLRRLAHAIHEIDPESGCYLSVDAQPVMERAWAERAGIGWVGKNSLVLRRDIGSCFFLGVVVTTMELLPDTPVPDHCGSCRACIEACPTDAIVWSQTVDANRCISYQTIENQHKIPKTVADLSKDWVFGCDICQEVCPWNRFAPETSEPAFLPREGVAHPDLRSLVHMDEATFDAQFAGTPVRRAKHAGMQRNARIALSNQREDEEG
jgi:epoxyqueuosine reductase